MSASLPPAPSLEQLRNQAKDVLRAYKTQDPSVCEVLRHLKQFKGKTDKEVLAGSLSLVQVQYALAIHYGFRSWQELKEQVGRTVSSSRGGVNYAGVELKGNGMVMDSFCLALAEACRLLNRPMSYETVLSLTLNALAPGFDTGNDCKELWVCHAWVSHIGVPPLAWQALGVDVTPLPLPTDRSDADAHRQACARRIRDAMDDGSVVVVTGGWEFSEGKWIEPWWAGVVTEVAEDGTVLGAHPNGRTDNAIAAFPPGEVLSIRAAQPVSDDGLLDAAVLTRAMSRIRGEGEFSRKEFCAFGLDAMDEWITQVSEVPHFCPPCQAKAERGWKSAEVVAQAAVHRFGVAANFLRQQADSLPPEAGEPLSSAAAHYEKIVSLLEPAITEGAGDGYAEFIGQLDKQRAHSDRVLQPARQHLAAIANDLEQVVAVM